MCPLEQGWGCSLTLHKCSIHHLVGVFSLSCHFSIIFFCFPLQFGLQHLAAFPDKEDMSKVGELVLMGSSAIILPSPFLSAGSVISYSHVFFPHLERVRG